jgi:cell division protein FtsL
MEIFMGADLKGFMTESVSLSRKFSVPWQISFSFQSICPITVFLAAAFAIAIFFVWSRTEMVRLEYQISRMERQVRDLRQEEQRMRLEVASLRSPQRIEAVASNDLGMSRPKPGQIVIVR